MFDAVPYFASKAAPAHRQPCRCSRLGFPHRPDWRCDALANPADWQTKQEIHDEALADFNAREARAINRDRV